MNSLENTSPRESEAVKPISEFDDYRFFVMSRIASGKQSQGRGLTKSLAETLRCHPTFISQVINEKADFSTEQALRFSRFFELSNEETDYFIDLLGLARAGDDCAKIFFRNRVEKKRKELAKFKFAIGAEKLIEESPHAHFDYYTSWIMQAVHATIQIEGLQTAGEISKYLGIRMEEIDAILSNLEKMGLAKFNDSRWSCTNEFLHIDERSPYIWQFHSQWRQRACQSFLQFKKKDVTHYSGALTFSQEVEPQVRAALSKCLDDIMKLVIPSKSETVFGLNVDFFPLRDN